MIQPEPPSSSPQASPLPQTPLSACSLLLVLQCLHPTLATWDETRGAFPTGGQVASQGGQELAGWEVERDTHFFFFFFNFFLVLLGPHLQHMEVPRLGVNSEPQLPAYTTATATPDLSHVCNPHHSSRQCPILNPLSEAKDRTRVLMDTSRVC